MYYRLVFDQITQDFGLVGLFHPEKEREEGGGICEIEKKVIKRMPDG